MRLQGHHQDSIQRYGSELDYLSMTLQEATEMAEAFTKELDKHSLSLLDGPYRAEDWHQLPIGEIDTVRYQEI